MKQKQIKSTVLFFILAVIVFIFATLLGNRLEVLPFQSTSTPTIVNFTGPDFTVTIPDKALIKNYLTVSVEAEPGTACRLTFIPPSGEIRVMETTANTDGLCKWRWKLEESIGRGHGRLIFTINGVSDTHFIDIRPGF